MSLSCYDAGVRTPFWQALDMGGFAVGVVDAPFAPIVGMKNGPEVLGWGTHVQHVRHRRLLL